MIAVDFAQLEYFKAVATNGSVSRAAETLHITQPALSRSIAKLEHEVGTPLFDRQNHRVVLNNYGRLFLASVDLAFFHLESGIKSVRRLYHSDQNILTIASNAHSTEDFIVSIVSNFVATNPNIAFRQFRYNRNEIETHLMEQDIDLAICSTPIESKYIQYEQMSQTEFVLVYNRSMELPETDPISLLQIKDEHFICDNSRMSSEYLIEVCASILFVPKIAYEVDNVELLHELLCSNAGVALVPLPYFWRMFQQLGAAKLAMRHIKEKIPNPGVGVAWLKERNLSASSLKFIDHIRKVLETNEMKFKQFDVEQTVSLNAITQDPVQ